MLTVANSARLSSEDVRLLQQADGVLLAVGGDEGQQVGGLRAGGEVQRVLSGAVVGETYFLAAAGEVGENGGGYGLMTKDGRFASGGVGVGFHRVGFLLFLSNFQLPTQGDFHTRLQKNVIISIDNHICTW